jgi:branched-chain amino acid transport system substrate-binding protein
MRANTRLLIRIGAAAFCAAALAACGSNRSITIPDKAAKPPKPNSHIVRVYSSLPLKGSRRQESSSIIAGIRLAFRQVDWRVGSYVIRFKSLDDSVTRAKPVNHVGTLPPAVRNAQIAVHDTHTVAYIGDLDSAATELSLPILNQAGIVQITPGSGYPGLTDSVPGVTLQGEPGKFYPRPKSFTLLRLIPDDMVQAAAALKLLHSSGCTHVAAAYFGGGVDGPALVKAVQLTAKDYGMTYVAAPPGPGKKISGYPAYALKLAQASVNCFVLGGHVTPAAVALTQRIHVALPTGGIVGSSGFCSRAWTDPSRHGVSAAVDPYLYCTSPLPPPSRYPVFIADFRRVYHRTPGAYALIGYRAAEMVIDGAYDLGSGRDNRSSVLRALIGGVGHPSPVAGNYTFDARGNLTTHAYAIYHVVDGRPKYYKTLTPSKVL